MIVSISLEGDKALIARMKSMPAAVHRALEIKVKILALKLEKLVKTGKLNGQVLNRITGALSRSISHRLEATASAVYGIVFSSGDVKYAGIHEYGGKTGAHVIEPKKAQALAFMMGGQMVFAKKVNHPGSKMPERSFLRSSLTDMSTEISLGMKTTVVETLQKQVNG